MRIISGKNKGKIIKAPDNLPVRPTTDMAKEALFNILENRYYINKKKVLDLFSAFDGIKIVHGTTSSSELCVALGL